MERDAERDPLARAEVRAHDLARGRHGSPFQYTGLSLHEAHKQLRLSSEEFDEVGAEIIRALDFFNVPEREKKELVDAYMASKPEVATASLANP